MIKLMVQLRSELDKLQDREDDKAGKHVEIPLTVAMLSALIHRSEVEAQKRSQQ